MTVRSAVRLALLMSCATIAVPSVARPGGHRAAKAASSFAPRAATAPLAIVDIPYTRMVLPNGLTLIVHEDHKVPVVSVATYYHVGSANETEGRTGFAHLFEHLMFNGSEHADGDWFAFMNEIGATGMNGSTGNDRTNYFETVPTSGLDRVLWYEADRMGNLLPAVDQAKLDEQRAVVQNEKRQRANSPLGKVPDTVFAATHPAGHPYSWTPIGSMEDLNAATLDDVKTFFKQWYGPSNAVLALSGDITPAEARAKVEKYYGDIPAGPPLVRSEEQVATMRGQRRDTLQARIADPQLLKVWNVPGWASKDAQLLRLAASALADGDNSPMQKHLVREQELASEIDVDVSMLERESQFTISATARPGVSLTTLEAAIDAEMAAFLRDGVPQATLDRIKFERYAGYVRGQASTMSKAQTLAEGELYADDPGHYRVRQEVTQEATPQTILATAQNWLSDGSYVLSIVPFADHQVSGTPVDWSTKPPLGTPEAFALPPLQHATLSNGAKVLLAERHDVPTVMISTMFDVGSLPDRDLASAGLSTAFGLATLGTTTRSTLDIQREEQELATGMSWVTTQEMTRFSVNALKAKLDPTLDLYADILLHPSFPKAEWERKLALFNANFEQNKRLPQGKVALIYSKMIYGEGHPYSVVSTPETLGKWTTDDFAGFYHKWIRPDLATILIVGDTTLDEIMPALEQRLGGWKAVGPTPVKPPVPDPVRPDKPRVILVDQPDAESSIVQVAETGPARDDPDYDALSVANTVLGGGFLSRLNLNLREEKGWSYGAKGDLGEAVFIGQIGAGSIVQTDKTAASMAEIDRELREIATTRKPTVAEIETARNAMLLGMTARLQDPSGALNLYRDAYQYHLPEDYWNGYVHKIQGFTPEQVQLAATRLYRPGELTWFVVGDLSKIESNIRELKLGDVLVYDADGNRVR